MTTSRLRRDQEPGIRDQGSGNQRPPPHPRSPIAYRLSPITYSLLLLAALLAAYTAVQLAASPHCAIGTEEDIGCARGFEARERDHYGSFRWTDGQAHIRLIGSGYGSPRIVEVTLAAPGSSGAAPTHLVLTADAYRVDTPASIEPRHYQLLLPTDFPTGDITTLALTSTTFTPQGNRRVLGVRVYDAHVRPLPSPRLPGPLLVLALLSIGLSATILGTSCQMSGTRDQRLGTRKFWNPGTLVALMSGVIAISAATALWIIAPPRVVPFLPAFALIIGFVTLLVHWLPAFDMRPVLLILPVICVNALGDSVIVAHFVRLPWIAVVLAAQAAFTVCAVARTRDQGPGTRCQDLAPQSTIYNLQSKIPSVLLIALVVRLLAFGVRLLAGHAASDPDTELFYSYGRATLELGMPIVEYPSGALVPWALMALPGSRELFALLLPLLNTLCDLAIVWGIGVLESGSREQGAGSREQENRSTLDPGPWTLAPFPFALFYALSPLLLPFWHAKYDPLPAALLVLGLVTFAKQRPGWSGIALGLGGTVKWVPWLAAPFLLWELVRPPDRVQPHWSSLAAFLGGLLASIAVVSLPFMLRDIGHFVMPYTIQGQRGIIGESIWFPFALLLEPNLLRHLPAPWSSITDPPIAKNVTIAVQLAVLGALLVLQILRPPDRRRTLTCAALAPAMFLLFNRVFSPQYLVLITAALLAAAASIHLRGRGVVVLMALLALMQMANLLVWPNTASFWLFASLSLFGVGIGVTAWLVLHSLDPPSGTIGAGRFNRR